MSNSLSKSIVALLLAIVIPTAKAASLAYTNTAGGSWETAANWSSSATPTIADTASVTNNGTYTVTLDDTTANTDPGGAASWLTINSLNIGNATGKSTLLLDFTNTAKSLTVTNVVFLGGASGVAGAHGDLIVSNGTLVVSNRFDISFSGTQLGNLNIYGGTVFDTPTGNALIMATASSSTGMILLAGGELVVTNGGTAVSIIGNGGRGVLTQSNGMARFAVLKIGASGTANGEWNLYGGTGQVLSTSASSLTLGAASGTTGKVLVAGGTLSMTGTVLVGQAGYGSITLSNGSLTASTVTVGAGGSGDLNVFGGSAQLVTLNVGDNAASSRGAVLITTGGTLAVTSQVNVGDTAGAQASLDIRGGTVSTTGGSINALRMGNAAGATGIVNVAGGSLTVTNTGEVSFIGNAGQGTMNVSNGLVILREVRMGDSSSGSGILNVVGGTNQILTTLSIGKGANLTGNVLVAGGRLEADGLLMVGQSGYGSLTVSNGTLLAAGGMNVASNTASSGDVRILGGTATVTNASGVNLIVGAASSTGTVLVSGPGVIEFNRSVTMGGATGRGYFTNQNGGTVRFITSANDPTFNVAAGSAFVITNALFEFKDYSGANLNGGITNITFQGNNTLSLNNSTNAMLGSYTFQTNNAPSFAYLQMINGTTRWQSTSLTIGSGGRLLASNTIGTVTSLLTNQDGGLIEVFHSTMTYNSNVVIQGRYHSDPSTNIFLSSVTITNAGVLQGGPLVGGMANVFDFKKDLWIGTTNSQQFDLSQSQVKFSGSNAHVNAIAGQDFGSNGLAVFGFAATNYSYGRFTIGSTNDTVAFNSGNGAASNALYVEWMDLSSLTGSYSSVASTVSNLLSAPSTINIYYAAFDANNNYLLDQTYALNGGGLLMPAIPEPSALALSVFALAGWRIGRSQVRRWKA